MKISELVRAAGLRSRKAGKKLPYPVIETPKAKWPTDNTHKNLSQSEGIAILKKLGIRKVGDLDRWIYSHVILEGPNKGSLMSRYNALKYLVGERAATFILNDLATDTLN